MSDATSYRPGIAEEVIKGSIDSPEQENTRSPNRSGQTEHAYVVISGAPPSPDKRDSRKASSRIHTNLLPCPDEFSIRK
jgi:hypothetical protein